MVGAGFSVCGSAPGFGCAWSNPVVSGSGSVLGGAIFLLERIYVANGQFNNILVPVPIVFFSRPEIFSFLTLLPKIDLRFPS